MTCVTQNVDITFNDDVNVGVIFDDDQAVALTFNDDQNVALQCDKFGAVAFAPEQALFEYFEADDLVLSDGASVDSWVGRNGEATLTQPGASNLKPTYRASAGGASLPAVEFDGVDDSLIANTLASLFEKLGAGSASPEGSVFMVFSSTAATNEYTVGIGNSGSTTQFFRIGNEGNLDWFLRNDGGGTQAAGPAGTVRAADESLIWVADDSADTVDVYYGNTQVTTGDALTNSVNTFTVNTFTLGALTRTSTFFWSAANIHAFGIVGTPLTAQQISDLQSYASSKWGY